MLLHTRRGQKGEANTSCHQGRTEASVPGPEVPSPLAPALTFPCQPPLAWPCRSAWNLGQARGTVKCTLSTQDPPACPRTPSICGSHPVHPVPTACPRIVTTEAPPPAGGPLGQALARFPQAPAEAQGHCPSLRGPWTRSLPGAGLVAPARNGSPEPHGLCLCPDQLTGLPGQVSAHSREPTPCGKQDSLKQHVANKWGGMKDRSARAERAVVCGGAALQRNASVP